mgnify:FL=1
MMQRDFGNQNNFGNLNLNPFQQDLSQGFTTQGLFQAALPTNLTFGQRQFFQNQYKPIFSEFLGSNVNRILGGGDAQTFVDYLRGFDFADRMRSAPSRATGMYTRPIVSSGRFLYGF